ncbi:hypothetical protein ACWKSP_39100 [Micromonosporaceae bacterium Da 78-11]
MKLNMARFWQRAVLVLIVAAGTGVVGASPAQATVFRGCDYKYWTPNGEGKLTFFDDYNLKAGPLGECAHLRSVKKGTAFYIWCRYENQYGNMWFYGRVAGTQTVGWAFRDAFGPKIELGDRDDDDNGDGITKLEFCGY